MNKVHTQHHYIHRHFLIWIVGCAAATITFLGIFIITQQGYRQSASDIEQYVAEQTAGLLNIGRFIPGIIGEDQIDIARSNLSFTIIYDREGKPIASTGLLEGVIPVIPIGVLHYAQEHGANRVTWQPRPDVRIASVSVPYKGGFVTVGKSLKETEVRIQTAAFVILWAWVVSVAMITLVTSGFALLMVTWYSSSRYPTK